MNAIRTGVRNPLVFLLFLLFFHFSLRTASGQTDVRIVEPVNNANRITLSGNVHPLARAEFDRGAVAPSQPMNRIFLLLKRSDAQEAALQSYLEQQQNKNSPDYHRWLSPVGFGALYGPADADIQAITQWLANQGFTINRVYSGKTVIEFSGSTAQVQTAFGTTIRNYQVNGKMYVANADDPQIPTAFAPVVAGIVSLNNFPRQSHVRLAGQARKVAGQPGLQPLFTFPVFGGNGSFYGVGPTDFATIYNTVPLLNAAPKVDGSGQTIAIVGETNINIADVQNFRQMFGLPANFTASNVILNGEDPGITSTREETEADLDVQWSGAAAPGATVDFVVSASTTASQGIDLSALYIIEHNLADIVSESYGACESGLGSAGNAFYNSLWQQAAAQGITVVVSSEDNGSAGCDDFNTQSAANGGLAVNGLASTNYNVAVGGTDFDQVNRWTTYWNASNNSSTGASAKSYIPEIPWSDTCAQFGVSVCANPDPTQVKYENIVASSGGASANYPKPTWQLGVTGVPNDNHRDLPDVSLFASSGFNESGYIICQQDQTYNLPCNLGLNSADLYFLVVGGTSASAPAFAGVMALVDQYVANHGGIARQGNADYVLYALAKKSGASCASAVGEAVSCVFNDVTHGNSGFSGSVGTNSVPCDGGKPNCSATAASSIGILVDPNQASTSAWTVSNGYDMATGLGSVNVNSLATNWATVSNVPTTTSLTLAPTSGITHGTAENVIVNITVSPSTAIGVVSLIAKFADGTTQGLSQFPLVNGKVVNGTTNSLPGGTAYTVTAHYAGDGTNAPSDSAPVTVTVGPESSKTFIVVPLYDPVTGKVLSGNASSVPYGSPYRIRVYVTNSASVASPTGPPSPTCDQVNQLTCPTGTVTLTANGTGVDRTNGVYALDNIGYTRDINPTSSSGTYPLLAQYSGDNSYSPSSAAVDTLVVSKAASSTSFLPVNSTALIGSDAGVITVTTSQSLGIAPTGQFTLYLDGVPITPDSYSSSGQSGTASGQASLQAQISFPTTSITSGQHTLSATYPGDSNYASSSTATGTVVDFANPTNVTLSVSNTNVVFGSNITLTATVTTTAKNPAILPTGINFSTQEGGTLQGTPTYSVLRDASGNTELQATLVFSPQYSDGLIVYYKGDSNFFGSTSNLVAVTVTIPNFNVTSQQPGLTITAGQSASTTIIVTPTTSLTSPVQLQIPYQNQGITCSISPAQVQLTGGNSSNATLTCSVLAPSSSTSTSGIIGLFRPKSSPRSQWWALSALLALLTLLFWFLPDRLRLHRLACASLLLGVLSLAIACGGGGSGGGGGGAGAGAGGGSATTTTLSVASTKVQSGANLMATVKVSGQSPTGQVTLGVVGVPSSINTGILSNGQAPFSYYLGSPGGYQMTAQYLGDAQNQPSQTHTPLAVVQTGVAGNLTINASSGALSKQVSVSLSVQ
jgi:Pro-kumamolisin, activation domain